ncbi:MAG: hypothetical protein WCP21_22815 [Armatimonadota bacterium]
MGGFVTCIPDAGFGNPAFAGTLTDTTAVLRRSTTSFSSGLDITGEQFSVATPLRANKSGVQITGFRLSTHDTLPALPPGNSMSFSEYDLAFHYGQRFGDHLVLGVGVSPIFHNEVANDLPVGGNFFRLRSTSDQGFRLGSLYQLGPDSWLGAVYDRYNEDVTASGPYYTGWPSAYSYTSEEMVVGYSRKLNDTVLAAVEWQQLTTEGNGTRQGDSGFRVGLEATLDNNVTFRAGSNDGSVSLGLGLQSHRLSLNYAFVDNWNREMVESTLGSSTTHQFEAAYRF